MKHLLLVLVASVGIYAAWVLSDKATRDSTMREVTRHGIRLGFIVIVLLLLLFAAVQLPSTSLV